MRMILQVSFVNRTNEVWKPSSYPQFGQTWSSFFMETGFGVLFSKYLLLYLLLMPLLLLVQFCRLNLNINPLLVQSSTIEPKHLAFFYNRCLFKAYCTVKTSGSICKIEPAFLFLPVDTMQLQQTLVFVSR